MVLHRLLTTPPEPHAVDSLSAWWVAHQAATSGVTSPCDRALLGGFFADRIGYAFAAGYQAALSALVPALGAYPGASLCATEERGNHPRSIETTLTPHAEGGFTLEGHKRWATLATFASCLLVVARTGDDAQGRPVLRVVRVAANAPGVTLEEMPPAPFVPELPHAQVHLADVRVGDEAVLPGDGYARYLKPFRTVEDLHVHAALLGHVLALGRRHGWAAELLERIALHVVATRALSIEPADSPATHVALAGEIAERGGLLAEVATLLDALPPEIRERWQRDRALLGVAGKAREARRLKAWERLTQSPVASDGGSD